jgi:2-dehydropantoate 2-reductase
MSLDHPIIAVVGAGALGGYYGSRLIQGGHLVHLHMRSGAAAVRQNGMKIQSRDGDFSLSQNDLHVHDQTATIPKADLVVVTLKTTANHKLPDLLEPLVKEDTAILTLQNGLGNEETIAQKFGADHVLGGIAFVCINRIAPGHISHTDHGLIQIAEFAGPQGDSPRARRIAQIFRDCKINCETIPNLMHGRWEKLVWNIPFNGLGALLDLSTDRLIDSETGLRLVRQLMEEVVAIAAGLGIRFPSDIIQRKIEHTQTMGAYKTSAQIDRQKKRPLEVEAIWGKPLQMAWTAGAITPALTVLYNMLKLADSWHDSDKIPAHDVDSIKQ